MNFPSLVTVELFLFIQTQFTTNIYSKCPAPELMHAWIGLIMDFRTFEGPARCESSNRQNTLVSCLFILNWSRTQ